jgi:hypothetical protein
VNTGYAWVLNLLTRLEFNKERKMKIEIKNRWSGSVIFGYDIDNNTVGVTVKAAIEAEIDLRDANLSDADLSGADLSDANLSDANLTPIRDDIWAVISSTPSEVSALIDALKNGRVNGSTYSGDCSCLVGTIATARRCSHEAIETLKPNSSRPAERFFLGINKGDTPETNQFSALAVQWCQEWLDRMEAAFGKREKQ